jgi:Cys-tRNA(Pro)/Cys-tRNA(Cys) deacylase
VFSGPGRLGGGHLMWSSGAAPSAGRLGGGDRRTGRSIRENGHMGAQGTRAIDAVRRAGVPHAVHEYAHDERASLGAGGRGYALEAVESLGIEAGRVFKTIVVSVDGRLALAVVAADAEVDLKAVADALGGRRAAIATPADAEKATGYVLGGISPLGTRRPLPTILDSSAGSFPTIHVSAGRRGLEIELAPGDLVALVHGSLASVARRPHAPARAADGGRRPAPEPSR